MKSKKIQQDSGGKTFVLVFSPGDQVPSQLVEFARRQRLDASRFTGIGGFTQVTLGYFELGRKDYKRIEVNEQVEVLISHGQRCDQRKPGRVAEGSCPRDHR